MVEKQGSTLVVLVCGNCLPVPSSISLSPRPYGSDKRSAPLSLSLSQPPKTFLVLCHRHRSSLRKQQSTSIPTLSPRGGADNDRLRWVASPYPRNPNFALIMSVTFLTCYNKRIKIYFRETLRAHFTRLFALSVYLGSLGAPRSLARLAK